MTQKTSTSKAIDYKTNAKSSTAINAALKSQSPLSPQERLLQLHRQYGNKAIQRMYESRTIQAKLKIGQPNDKYELEADQVAEHVMSIPDPQIGSKTTLPFAKYSQGGDEESSSLQRASEHESIQTKPLVDQVTVLVQRQIKPAAEEALPTKTDVLEFSREKGVPSEMGAKVLEIIEDQIEEGKEVPNECVKASLERIKDAYAELGGTKFPPHGALEVFEVIWNSATKSKYWKEKFQKKLKPYKGKGGAGAIFYAGLGYIVPWNKIWTDLRPGAVLQLWENWAAYEEVRDKQEVSSRGHSVIFSRYIDKATTPLRRTIEETKQYSHEAGMLIIEQYGEDVFEKKSLRQVARSNLRWRYGVGANFYPLKKPPSDEASPLE